MDEKGSPRGWPQNVHVYEIKMLFSYNFGDLCSKFPILALNFNDFCVYFT